MAHSPFSVFLRRREFLLQLLQLGFQGRDCLSVLPQSEGILLACLYTCGAAGEEPLEHAVVVLQLRVLSDQLLMLVVPDGWGR